MSSVQLSRPLLRAQVLDVEDELPSAPTHAVSIAPQASGYPSSPRAASPEPASPPTTASLLARVRAGAAQLNLRGSSEAPNLIDFDSECSKPAPRHALQATPQEAQAYAPVHYPALFEPLPQASGRYAQPSAPPYVPAPLQTVLGAKSLHAPIGELAQGVHNPSFFSCPLSDISDLDRLMRDPVVLLETGATYERSNIEAYFNRQDPNRPLTSPEGLALKTATLTPNIMLRDAIVQFRNARAFAPNPESVHAVFTDHIACAASGKDFKAHDSALPMLLSDGYTYRRDQLGKLAQGPYSEAARAGLFNERPRLHTFRPEEVATVNYALLALRTDIKGYRAQAPQQTVKFGGSPLAGFSAKERDLIKSIESAPSPDGALRAAVLQGASSNKPVSPQVLKALQSRSLCAPPRGAQKALDRRAQRLADKRALPLQLSGKFVPSAYQGPRAGYTFKQGSEGQGYYKSA